MLSYLSNAGVVKLADTLDLGSSSIGVQVRFLSPAPFVLIRTSRKLEVLFYIRNFDTVSTNGDVSVCLGRYRFFVVEMEVV